MRTAVRLPSLAERERKSATLIPFPRFKKRANNFTTALNVKTHRPSWRSQSKLLTLLIFEIESAARLVRDHIKNNDKIAIEDGIRFIERQISFLREVNSIVLHR